MAHHGVSSGLRMAEVSTEWRVVLGVHAVELVRQKFTVSIKTTDLANLRIPMADPPQHLERVATGGVAVVESGSYQSILDCHGDFNLRNARRYKSAPIHWLKNLLATR
ncbi:hypothetical protein SNK05_008420 [Fusarium graminearum]